MTMRRLVPVAALTLVMGAAIAPGTAAQATVVPDRVPAAPDLTCAQGGTCQVGDIGPGGGVVFYVATEPINVAPPVSSGGIYLEAAPAGWFEGSDYRSSWCDQAASNSWVGTQAEIGTGARNTGKIAKRCGDSALGEPGIADYVSDLELNGHSDWFVPSIAELEALRDASTGLIADDTRCWNKSCYWSSTESEESSVAQVILVTDGVWYQGNNSKTFSTLFVRPVRAFSPKAQSTPNPAPSIGKPKAVKAGFSATIRNYSPSCTWQAAVMTGEATAKVTKTKRRADIAVTIRKGASATVRVYKTCPDLATVSTTITGTKAKR